MDQWTERPGQLGSLQTSHLLKLTHTVAPDEDGYGTCRTVLDCHDLPLPKEIGSKERSLMTLLDTTHGKGADISR